jgi:hypothetical protein
MNKKEAKMMDDTERLLCGIFFVMAFVCFAAVLAGYYQHWLSTLICVGMCLMLRPKQ